MAGISKQGGAPGAPPPIRVALLATVIDFGGIERVLLTMLRNMDLGVELIPILYTRTDLKEKSFFDSLRDLEVPHDTLYVNTRRMKYLNPIQNILETIACFRGKRFDLIHTHGYRANLIGLAMSRRFSLPIVSTCHGYISIDRHLALYNRLDVFLLRYFDRVIAVSDRMKMDLVGKGVHPGRISVIINAAGEGIGGNDAAARRETRSRLGIREGIFVYGFVGRLSEEKGVDYLIDAVKGLSYEKEPWRLIVLGDGPRRQALENAVRESGLTHQVLFVGFQSDTEAWYPAMDAFVLPSLTEGTPMVLLEAMAHGIPVIATSVGGVPAILSGKENGILVPPADPTRLLEAMRIVAGDPDLRRRLSDGGIRSVHEGYDVTSWKRKLREVYTTTLRESRRTA